MKIYVKSAVNISDIQAKIAKKQAEIDKKKSWIVKKEAAIQKKLNILRPELTNDEYTRLSNFLEELKVTRRSKIADEDKFNYYELRNKYGWEWGDARAEAAYNIIQDAESIFNSKEAIDEAQAIIDKYEAKISAEKAKNAEIDEIPECLKEFMNDIIDRWDKYDIKLRNESKPYYNQLVKEANDMLYGEDRSRTSAIESDNKLKELYPDLASYRRYTRFKEDYIYTPFKRRFGVGHQYASSLWEMDDAKIHEENEAAGKNLILDLLKRVTKITGPVIDWSGLDTAVGNGGRLVLNGLVIGEDGKAEVESILASGPVQRLHIRTLVKPIK